MEDGRGRRRHEGGERAGPQGAAPGDGPLVGPDLDPGVGGEAGVGLAEGEADEVPEDDVDVAVVVVVAEIQGDVARRALLRARGAGTTPGATCSIQPTAVSSSTLPCRSRFWNCGWSLPGRNAHATTSLSPSPSMSAVCARWTPGMTARSCWTNGYSPRFSNRRIPWKGRIVKSSRESPLVISTSRSPSPSKSTTSIPEEPQTGVMARKIVSWPEPAAPRPGEVGDQVLVLLGDEGHEVHAARRRSGRAGGRGSARGGRRSCRGRSGARSSRWSGSRSRASTPPCASRRRPR